MRFELKLSESESEALSITPHNLYLNDNVEQKTTKINY